MTINFTYYHVRNSRIKNWLLSRSVERTLLGLAAECEIEGFTVSKALGAWKGSTEPSFVLQLEGVPSIRGLRLAERLRDLYHQDAVMVKSGGKVRFV